MNLESDIDELLYEYPTTARVHNALQKCEEIKQIKDLINEDGSFVGYFMAIPNIGKKSAMEIDQMRRWFVKNHLTPHQENQIIYAGRCWIIAYTSFSPEVDHWECQEEEETARRRYLELLDSGNWDIVSLTAVIESTDYETHPKFLVERES
jgi:hypothetical protein